MKHWTTEYQMRFIMVPLQHKGIRAIAGAGNCLIPMLASQGKNALTC